jgi:outer membrane biosynthesis protein TonB
MGVSTEEALDVRNRMMEGKFPERQAYNANGILVTFPTPEYKQRAIKRGTHFEKNPKQKAPNVSFDEPQSKEKPESPEEPKPEPKSEPAPKEEPKPEPKPEPTTAAPPEPPKPQLPSPIDGVPVLVLPPGELKKREDAIIKQAQEDYVEKILTNESTKVKFTLDEARSNNFYNKGFRWYDSAGEFIGVMCYDERSKNCFIIG